jgi:hypothetical protein
MCDSFCFDEEIREMNQEESMFPSNTATDKIDDLNYFDDDSIDSVTFGLLPQICKVKNRQPKRKRQPLDAISTSFDISSVLPEAGEAEWNPGKNQKIMISIIDLSSFKCFTYFLIISIEL